MGLSDTARKSPDELEALLRDYLLCTQWSPLAMAANALVKSDRFGLPVEIAGPYGAAFRRVRNAAKALNVTLNEVEYTPKAKAVPTRWVSEVSGKVIRVWVPEIRQRLSDLGLLMSFFIEYHLDQLRKKAPEFPEPKVCTSYILLMWAQHVGRNHETLGARLLKDLLYTEKSKKLAVWGFSGYLTEDIRAIHGQTRNLTEIPLRLLGMTSDAQLAKEIKDDANALCKAFIGHTQSILGATSFSGPGKSPRFAWCVRPMSISLGSLPLTVLNIYLHQFSGTAGQKERVLKCLDLRLRNWQESDILVELGFKNDEEYQKWLLSNSIAVAPPVPFSPLQRWLDACKDLGIEPDEADLGLSDSKNETGDLDARSAATSNDRPIIRFGPDHRSVALPSGQSVSLTPKQAQVIQLLDEACQNGTPELSQAHLIEEVYGAVSENRLKKLFANNEAWDLLIEPGSRRGLVRLKQF